MPLAYAKPIKYLSFAPVVRVPLPANFDVAVAPILLSAKLPHEEPLDIPESVYFVFGCTGITKEYCVVEPELPIVKTPEFALTYAFIYSASLSNKFRQELSVTGSPATNSPVPAFV